MALESNLKKILFCQPPCLFLHALHHLFRADNLHTLSKSKDPSQKLLSFKRIIADEVVVFVIPYQGPGADMIPGSIVAQFRFLFDVPLKILKGNLFILIDCFVYRGIIAGKGESILPSIAVLN